MIPELGKYAGTVLSAYAVSLILLAGIIALSAWQARRVKRRLDAAEAGDAMAKVSPLMILPPLLFAGLAVMFYVGMNRDDPEALPSALVGQPAPPWC